MDNINDIEIVKLSNDEFIDYKKSVKKLYLNVTCLVMNILLIGVSIILIFALQNLSILNVSNEIINIFCILCVVLFILLIVFNIKNIIKYSKDLHLGKKITLNSSTKQELNDKYKYYKIRNIVMILITIITSIIGVVLLISVTERYVGNVGLAMLSIVSMFLLIMIPLFITIYLYSDIYIYRYVNDYYNL